MATQTVAESTLTPVLQKYAAGLITEGYRILYYPDTHGHGRAPVRWLIAERNGHTATVEEGYFRSVSVSFPIRPSREYGSGLLVWGGDDEYALGMGDAYDAVRVATSGEPFANFANPGHPLPNDGMAHFDWAKDSLIELIREA